MIDGSAHPFVFCIFLLQGFLRAVFDILLHLNKQNKASGWAIHVEEVLNLVYLSDTWTLDMCLLRATHYNVIFLTFRFKVSLWARDQTLQGQTCLSILVHRYCIVLKNNNRPLFPLFQGMLGETCSFVPDHCSSKLLNFCGFTMQFI